MSQQDNLAAQGIALDFGGEVPYAFGFCPENKRRNDEMFRRAEERAKLNRHPAGDRPVIKVRWPHGGWLVWDWNCATWRHVATLEQEPTR